MSRRRAAQQAPTVPADDLHRAALERRAARMAQRTPGPAAQAVTPAAMADRVTAPAAGPASASSAGPSAPRPVGAAISTTVPVAGMTCRSCEVRIQRHVGRLPGVERVTASAVHGRVVIESSRPVSAEAVEKAINDAGYEVGRTAWIERDTKVWLTAGGAAAALAAIVLIARATGVSDLAAGTGDLASGGLLVALLLGLTAGVSTCMALVGGLLLALTAAFEAGRTVRGDGAGTTVATRMRPALVFMLGRVAGYAALGALLGAFGATVSMPPQVTAALMIVVAVLMTLIGARLTGLSPRLATWSPTLPMGLARTLGIDAGRGSAGTVYSDVRAAALGAASFFLPCGFTQAVQVFALSTGSPLYAGAIMAVFAIGTAPGLLALAGLPMVVPATWKPTLLRVAGVVVIVFALVNASAGLRLAGIRVPGLDAPAAVAAEPSAPVARDGVQTLTTYQDGNGYSPANVAIYAGRPTRWTVQSSDVRTCAAFLVVPDLGIQVALHKGDNVIDLPALPAGTIAYSCSMGMYGGQITVVEPPAG